MTRKVTANISSLTAGATRDHSASFIQTRQKVVDRTYLEVNRLEKRLAKVQNPQTIPNIQLLALMANPPKPEPVQGGFLKSLTGGGQNPQRLLEQQVVTWQDDETVTQCPFCESLLNAILY